MMNKAYVFVLGGTSTITLSIFLFVLAPRVQVSNINKDQVSAQLPYTSEELDGRQTYIENGCVYCHSQQVRDPFAGADKYFGWGRPSLPSDYIHDKPHLLGTMRTGPDLSNIGSRQPSKDWHHLHLYDPRAVVSWSIMPGFSFLYDTIESKEKPDENALLVPGEKNLWIRPSEKAENLVLYLLSLKRDREPLVQGEGKK
ncbi:MAG: cbb3-type cytochrome c oxidase subunit II [Bdellovibrionales bacterium]